MSAKNVVWAVKAHGELGIITVDAIQGGEAVIVIVDLVAAGETASPFVQDYRRLNGAVSRARDGLIIVGDSKSVDQDTLKDATVPNPKTNKVKKLSKRDLYTSIFLRPGRRSGFSRPTHLRMLDSCGWPTTRRRSPQTLSMKTGRTRPVTGTRMETLVVVDRAMPVTAIPSNGDGYGHLGAGGDLTITFSRSCSFVHSSSHSFTGKLFLYFS